MNLTPEQQAQVDRAMELAITLPPRKLHVAREGHKKVMRAHLEHMVQPPQAILDLLAVIHGDGGHHTAEHGPIKSAEHAQKVVCDDRTQRGAPVAWIWRFEDGELGEQPFEEKDDCEDNAAGYDGEAIPLFTAPQQQQPEPLTCAWTLDDDENGTWASSCGKLWSFIDGGPTENRVSYCHHCGGKVAIAAHEARQRGAT